MAADERVSALREEQLPRGARLCLCSPWGRAAELAGPRMTSVSSLVAAEGNPQVEDKCMVETENSFLRQICDELRQDRLVPVIGAGVSVGAAGLPNWSGAVEMAVRHLRETKAADLT